MAEESYDLSLDITGENLEDLLAYDDLFLDYFNAFLALPVFPQAFGYNRLTGAFEEVDVPELTSSVSGYVSPSVQYGATTAECEKMLSWAREERLPLFLRTQIFRELKLVKLLLRPLEDRLTASRNSSRDLRGYSRQSESYISSLSNSADNSADDVLDDDDFGFPELRHSALYRYRRPGSNAFSDPMGGLFFEYEDNYSETGDTGPTDSMSKSAGPVTHRNTSTGMMKNQGTLTDRDYVPYDERNSVQKSTSTMKKGARISSEVEVFPADGGGKSYSVKYSRGAPYSSTEEAFLQGARALSAPINYEQFMKMPHIDDFDAIFGEAEPEPAGQSYVEFEDDRSDDEKTETDVRNMEGRLKMSLQQMKEQVLGTLAGMEAFKSFLQGTSGDDLLNFWLDCEFYKDLLVDEEEDSSLETRNRLFRDIQDKYKLRLTQDARDQICKSASNVNLSHTIFLRTQYDVLRRLRAYWVPRFLLHYERAKPHSFMEDSPTTVWDLKRTAPKNQVPFFPSISLVSSMPLRPDDARASSMTLSWDKISKVNRSRDILSAHGRRPSTVISHGSSKDRFLLALSADRLAGGPFQRYLEKNRDQLLLSTLLFWEDVTEYGATEDKSADRLLRLQHAWAIFNKFLAQDGLYCVGIPAALRNQLHQSLLEAKDFVEASIYDSAKYLAVDRLEKAWIRFLKEDLKAFLDCRVRPGADSPPSTAEAIEITVTDSEVIIKRPRPWVRRIPGSTASERACRLQKALLLAEDIDSERRALNKKVRAQRRKEMERERKKAIRAAYARQREARFNKGESSRGEDGEDEEGKDSDSLPSYTDMHGNRQLMAMFRKYIQDGETKNLAHYPFLYNDLDTYFDMKDNKQKKDSHAGHIYKTYLDSHSKKFAPLPEKISSRVSGEKDRPKTATLKEVHQHVQSKLNELFKEFLLYQAEEFGVDPSILSGMSQSELAMRMGADTGSWTKRKHKGKENGEEEKSENQVREITLESIKIRVFEQGKRSKKSKDASDAKPQPAKRKPPNVKIVDKRETRSRETAPMTERMSTTSSQETSVATPSSSLLAARRARRAPKSTGRAHPTREDKIEFLRALGESALGHPTIQMLYFYKYLVKHGPEDNMPLIDKDLFFYIEVQKFKDCSHAHSNEELLRAKVQSIVECFIESVTAPALQVDITPELQGKTTKSTARYLQGKDFGQAIFDDAQFHVFKELLPYWAGFMKSVAVDAKKKAPKTKYQKMIEKRLDSIQNYEIPPCTFTLPPIPEGAVPAFTITLSEGVKFKYHTEASGVLSVSDKASDKSVNIPLNTPPLLFPGEAVEDLGSLPTPMPDRASKVGMISDKARSSRAKMTSASTSLSSGATFHR